MAPANEHIAQARRNQVVADQLSQTGEYDWAVTTLFYAALHIVQAYSISRGADLGTHAERARWMRQVDELGSILHAYRVLRSRSEDARYECRRFTLVEFGDLRTHEFARVSEHVMQLLRR